MKYLSIVGDIIDKSHRFSFFVCTATQLLPQEAVRASSYWSSSSWFFLQAGWFKS